jgi:predicted kinase
MATLYVMCGIPGSGKTSFIKSCEMQNTVHISRDECRFKYLREGEDYFAHEKEVFDDFVSAIDANINLGFSVFADATHMNWASRNKLLRSIKSRPEKIEAIWMNTPFEICMERNLKRSGRECVPTDAMIRFNRNKSIPTFDEGFTTIYTVTNGHIDVEKEWG